MSSIQNDEVVYKRHTIKSIFCFYIKLKVKPNLEINKTEARLSWLYSP